MTFSIEPHYVYLGATTVLAILQIVNSYRIKRVSEELDSLWKQIAMMAIASAGAFDGVSKKLDEKADKEKK